MIRAKISKLISTKLDSNKYFNFNDFQIEIGDFKYKSTKLKITYEYDSQYFIEIDIPSEKSTLSRQETTSNIVGPSTTKTVEYLEYKIEGKMCPGQLSYSEAFKYEGVDGINKALGIWLNNLWEDLTITPENRIFMAQKEEIEKIKEKVNGLPDEYFSAEEGNELKIRLEKLETQLTDQLTAGNPDKVAADKQIEKLHQEIEILKQTIHSIKKNGWFKSFVTKTMTWLADPNNQKLLNAGKEMITNMLPEGKD